MNIIVIVTLLVMLITQQVFYSWQIQRLINKLMSRNYGEFVQSNQIPHPRMKVKVPDARLDEDLRILNDMGRI